MRKIYFVSFYTFLFLLFLQPAGAAVKTWNGGSSGSWSNPANWSPAGVPAFATDPAFGDDITFDGSLASTVTITDFPAHATDIRYGYLLLINSVTVNLSSASNTYFYLENGLRINTGSRLNIGASTATIFGFGSRSATTSYADIYGTIDMKGSGAGAKEYYPSEFGSRTNIYGRLIFSGPASNLSTASNTGNCQIQSGGTLEWGRDGTNVPAFRCTDGGVIDITGVVTAAPRFSDFGNYYGLIIWNSPGQTAENLSIVPYAGITYNVDSVRVVNHGSGSVSLSARPCYSVGHVELMSGTTLALGRPALAACGANAILTDLKLNPGSTLIGNGTFTGDAAAYPFTVTVYGNLIIDNATFNFSNRPTANMPGGAMNLRVMGNVTQTGGNIFTTSSFGSQNILELAGAASQTTSIVSLGSGTYALSLYKTGTTQGASLTNNLTIPSNAFLVLNSGQLALDNYTLTVPYSNLYNNNLTPFPRIVTNGTGKLKLTGIPASSAVTFPVSALKNPTYEPLTITTTAAAGTHDYSVRVGYGNTPGGIYSPTKTIRRTWVVNASPGAPANQVGLTFQYHDTAKGSACIPTALMEEGHFVGAVWNVDPSLRITPTGANPYTVGPFYPNSLDSSFVIGNQSSILEVKNNLMLKAERQANNILLSWSSSIVADEQYIEYSTDGIDFRMIATLGANETRYTDITRNATVFYRIKAKQSNGSLSFSNIVKAGAVNSGTVSVLPTTVKDAATVWINLMAKAQVNIFVADASGRVLLKKEMLLNEGFNKIPLDLNALKAGICFVRVVVDGREEVRKIIKINY